MNFRSFIPGISTLASRSRLAGVLLAFHGMFSPVQAEALIESNADYSITISGSSSFDCLDPAAVGTIGAGGDCDGLLIVDDSMLRGAASTAISGNGTFALTGPDAQTYTFANGPLTVFTGQVTNMAGLFSNTSFNENISHWDTSSVTSMSSMFQGNTSFNQNISSWDVSNVTNMTSMFSGATGFKGNLNPWCVPQFATKPTGFSAANQFNEPIWGYCGLNDVPAPSASSMMLTYSGTTAGVVLTTPNALIYWGDGTVQRANQSTTYSHTYAGVGPWNVKISGTMSAFRNTGASLTSVDSFGSVGLTSLVSAFSGANNLSIVAALPTTVTNLSSAFYNNTGSPSGLESWDTSNVTNMTQMFRGSNFNGDISGWNTGAVTNMSYMFQNATAFNGNISAWNTGAVTNMSYMFQNATAFNRPIGSWDVRAVTTFESMFQGATAFTADLSSWCNEKIKFRPANFATVGQITEPMWGFCGAVPEPSPDSMVLTYTGTTVKLNLTSPNAIIYWGDGVATKATTTGTYTRTYASGDLKQVKISGTMVGFVNNSTTATALISVDSFGSTGITTLANAFAGANNLTSVAQLPPTVTNLSSAFLNNTGNPVGLESWDVVNVTNMSNMFKGSTINLALNGWNVSNVTNMASMFQSSAYNQPLDAWNVSNVTNMEDMFASSSFKQSLASWCVTKISTRPTSFAPIGAFQEPYFGTCGVPSPSPTAMVLTYTGNTAEIFLVNGSGYIHWGDGWAQPFTASANGTSYSHTYASSAAWTVKVSGTASSVKVGFSPTLTSVDSFGSLGLTAVSFLNSDLLASVAPLPTTVTSLYSAFNGNDGTLSGVENWDTSRVTNMGRVFANSSFNGDLAGWDTSSATTMEGMFSSSDFNSDISGWDVSNVANMESMFQWNSVFNQDISKWKTSNVTNMVSMFSSAYAMRRDLSSWCVTKIATKPDYFNAGNLAFVEPVWGTCPTP